MANTIPESYASPLLRWALCVEDYPGATHAFDLVAGTQLGIPESFGGKGQFLRCVISFGRGSGREDAVGWKPALGRTPDDWNTLSTKALGRALKRAGYPDDMVDLKACVLWRQRRAEIAAIEGGGSSRAIGPGAPETVEAALEAAAVGDPEHLGVDDAPEPHRQAPIAAVGYDGLEHQLDDPDPVDEFEVGDSTSGHPIDPPPDGVDPETGEIDPEPAEETLLELRRAMTDSAKAGTQAALRSWVKEMGWSSTRPDHEVEARAIIAKAAELAEAPM